MDFSTFSFKLRLVNNTHEPSTEDIVGTIHQLEAELPNITRLIDGHEHSLWIIQSHIGTDWDEAWQRLGPLLQQCLPNLKHFVSVLAAPDKVPLLFPHISTVTYLLIFANTDQSLLFQSLPSLRNLRSLSMFGSAGVPLPLKFGSAAIKNLKNSIESLPALEYVSLGPWTLFDASLEPLLKVLQTKKSLQCVRLNPRGSLYTSNAEDPDAEPIRSEVYLPDQELKLIQLNIRINKIIKNYNLPEDGKCPTSCHPQWLEAMLFVQEEFECFHFFFSTLFRQLPTDHILSVSEHATDHLLERLYAIAEFQTNPSPEDLQKATFRQLAGLPPLH